MKHSRLLSTSILIALALLLSSAKGANALNPRNTTENQNNQRGTAKQPRQEVQQAADYSATIAIPINCVSGSDVTKKPKAQHQTPLQSPETITALSTGLLAVFALWQLGILRKTMVLAQRASWQIGEPPKFAVNIVNIGQTPAYACIAECWTELVDPPFCSFSERSIDSRHE